jgi:hypothetical protein
MEADVNTTAVRERLSLIAGLMLVHAALPLVPRALARRQGDMLEVSTEPTQATR